MLWPRASSSVRRPSLHCRLSDGLRFAPCWTGNGELDFDEFADGNLLGLRLLFDERLVELFETEPLLLFDRLAAGRDWVLRFAPLSPDLPLA